MLQGILSIYLVNPDGGLLKKNEVDMKIARMFQKPKAGNMSLTRSKCKQFVTITSFERDNKHDNFIQLYAWEIKTLGQV